MAAVLDGSVAKLEDASVASVDSSLRRTGTVPAATAHVLCQDADPPYVASVISRPIEPGEDAAVAIASMGCCPGALQADRIVVCWEQVQLADDLGQPGALALPPALMVLDADRTKHRARDHPVRWSPPPDGSSLVVLPEWAPACHVPVDGLPEPITRPVAVWQAEPQWSANEIRRVFTSLEHAGYSLRWVQPALGTACAG